MDNVKIYELKTSNKVIEKELDNIIAGDVLNNIFVVGTLNFFGMLVNFREFKTLKKALRYFNKRKVA